MNLPNKITALRFVLIGALLVLLWCPGLLAKVAALAVFLLAGFTDYLDGYWARRLNMVTRFGQLMDPLADKIFISAAFIAFVEMGYVAAWIVIVIISREFLITGLRLVAALDGKLISARGSAKHKTVYQLIAIGGVLVQIIMMEWVGMTPGAFVNDWIHLIYPWFGMAVEIIIYVSVLLTVISGIQYLRDHRDVFTGQL